MIVDLDSALASSPDFVAMERHERIEASTKPLALQDLHRYNREEDIAFPSICQPKSAQLDLRLF